MSKRHMGKAIPFIIFLLCLGLVSCSAQRKARPKKKEDKQYTKAKEAYRSGEYEKAIKAYNEIIKKNSEEARAYAERAVIYYELKKYEEAEQDFRMALDLDFKQSDRLYLSLATVQRLQEKYSEAASSYGKYLENCNAEDERCQRAQKYYDNSLFASEAIKNPVDYDPKPIHANINNTNSQYLPHFTIDGSKMIYTERVGRQEDLYVSFKSDSSYSSGKPIKGLNTSSNEGAHCISPDGNQIIFTVCDNERTYGSCDLFQSVLTDKGWTRPRNLGKNLNSSAWDSQPSISGDGNRLYFASKREGGLGGSDIYVATKSGNAWGNVTNLGPQVNSKTNDESPFIHHDNRTLYFRSDGHPGMGDYDLFIARRKSLNENFNEIVNMGYPINSPGSEGGLYVSLDGQNGFFASDQSFYQGKRSSDLKKHLDIYVFDIPEKLQPYPVTYFKASVVDAENSKPLNAIITIEDLNTKELYFEKAIKADEELLVPIPVGTNYIISIQNPDYIYHSENFSLGSVYGSVEPLEKIILLYRIPKEANDESLVYNKPIILNNIFFETNSATLLEESFIEINKLSEQLVEQNALQIKIQGHTDNIGTEENNLSLSTARAKSVYDALIQSGISRDRLQYIGLGESTPIATNDSEEGRQKNRRTEFVIIGA